MKLEIRQPSWPLGQFVKTMIYYEGYTADCDYEQLLPDGNTQLIIELDGNHRVIKGTRFHPAAYFKTAWITGIQTIPVTYQSEKDATTLCIQFETGGLFSLLGIPATELKDTMVDATLVLGNAIVRLREKLLACKGADDIFRLACRFLEKRLTEEPNAGNILNFVKQKVCWENMNHTDMSRESGYSKKHLIQVFKKHVGVSPKRYQRLFRFNRALSLLNSQENPDYANVSLQCHFYDQAHFIKEFSRFSGRTPGQYLKIHRDYPHVLPLNNSW